MEGLPLKMPQAVVFHEEEAEVAVPDYLAILRDTQYEFTLENWALNGLQSSLTSHHWPQTLSSSSGLLPSCPPYWMLFSSPQQSRLASRHSSDFWEPNPRQRSHSLNPAVLRAKFTITDSENEEDNSAQEEMTCAPENTVSGKEHAATGQNVQRRAQRAFVPDLLNPPSCLSSLPHKRRKNLRQCSVSVMDESDASGQTQSPSSLRAPTTRVSTSKTNMSVLNTGKKIPERTKSCRSPMTASPHHGLTSALDSSVELLSALSPEERELLGAITARGYPLRTAIMALQRTGQQTPEQILGYLVACEHLCQLGYDMAQVEEALEMFQNCESKAQEFLHLLSQFNEMGFQPNTIKEVLLVHENHRERALEELMMHVA